MSDEYLIRRIGADAEGCAMWWRSHGCGYTTDLMQAGVYSVEEAEKICQLRDREEGKSPPEVALTIQQAMGRVPKVTVVEGTVGYLLSRPSPAERDREPVAWGWLDPDRPEVGFRVLTPHGAEHAEDLWRRFAV